MRVVQAQPDRKPARKRAIRLGCVRYLNAKPLIDGIGGATAGAVTVRYDVPARLSADLEADEVDLALCPVIDYFRAATPLAIVPVGGICCDGPTLTVRLFSRVPIERIERLHADRDSHTSVVLAGIVLEQLYQRQPTIIDYDAHDGHEDDRRARTDRPEAMLLIGDKVVTASPRAIEYPHQLDLGEAWKQLTGLPFVFAVWMSRAGADLGDLPRQLERLRDHNAGRIAAIVDRHAAAHGWPADLAGDYLGRILRYRIGEREMQAIERFADLAAESHRPLEQQLAMD